MNTQPSSTPPVVPAAPSWQLSSEEQTAFAGSKSTPTLPPAPPPITENILQERQKVHGDFQADAYTAQSLKDILHLSPNWETLTVVQREALEMICTKLGRIVVGNPNHQDHWDDIAGYALLVSKRL